MHWQMGIAVLTTAALVLCSKPIGADTATRDSTLDSLASQLHIATSNGDGEVKSFLPNYIEGVGDDNVKPYGEKSPVIFRHKLLQSEQFRRLVGDLETCGTDLLLYGPDDELELPAQVTKSSIMSCREAIFTFLRWVKGDNSHLDLLTMNNAELMSTGLYGRCECASPINSISSQSTSSSSLCENGCEQLKLNSREIIDTMEHLPVHIRSKRQDAPTDPKPELTGGPNSTPETPQLLSCKENVCRIGDLKTICTKPKSRMTTAQIDVCKMCYPKDEARLNMYCSVREQREQRAFWVAAGMLGALAVAVGGAIFFNDCVRKRKKRPLVGQMKLKKEGKLKTFFARVFRRMRKCFIRFKLPSRAVREPPGHELVDIKEGMFTGGFSDSDDGNGARSEFHGGSGLKKVDKALVKTGTPGNGTTVGVIPVMPRARASNTQLHHLAVTSLSVTRRSSEDFGGVIHSRAPSSSENWPEDPWEAQYRPRRSR